jgi:hypothetical protein
MEKRCFNEVDLSFVHTEEYEKTWLEIILFVSFSDAFLYSTRLCS